MPANTPNASKILAIAMAAKAAGASVSFQGACNGDPLYFNINYIIVD
ncbi:MAG: hypothetical protein WDO68_19890 [Gammaproteobacteria bacterium]